MRLNGQIRRLIFSPNVGLFLIVAYVSFINFFVIKSTPEIIFLQFAVLVLVFRRFRSGNFVRVWVPFIALFVLYEFLRGYADNFSPFYKTTLFWVYEIESKLLNGLLTVRLQKVFASGHWITRLSIFFYSLFFYFSFLVAFVVWIKNEKKFRVYFKQFTLLTYAGLLLFFLIPTAPPWLVVSEKGLDLTRYLLESNILNRFSYLSVYHYYVYGNPVAALPSLHVAWPFFSTLFLVKNFKSPFLYALFAVPAMIAFCVVLTGEHYIIDVLLGALFAVVVVYGWEPIARFISLRLKKS